jgi:hypothetical protein
LKGQLCRVRAFGQFEMEYVEIVNLMRWNRQSVPLSFGQDRSAIRKPPMQAATVNLLTTVMRDC